MRSRGLMLLACGLLVSPISAQGYFEGFDVAGKPADRHGLIWDYRAQLSPVNDWKEIIPGDGYAYLTAEREFLKRHRRPWRFWPFQTLSVGPVGAGHRISMRAKNTAIPGLAAMIFTYREQDTVDEIDLEITATDTESPTPRHKTGPDGGWTDLRLATWIEADRQRPEPTTLVKQPARDSEGEKMSLQDDQFHVYTIEWDEKEVRFFIDDVLQHTIEDAVPDRPARVIFGLRQMPWAGEADWEDPQTMTVDWVSIEPLEREGDQ
jgi:hypothetical protein